MCLQGERHHLFFQEQGRRVLVEVEHRLRNDAIYTSSIERWEAPEDRALTEEERRHVVECVVATLKFWGLEATVL